MNIVEIYKFFTFKLYININVSEINSGNCGNSTTHVQNIIFSPNRAVSDIFKFEGVGALLLN